MKKIIVIVAVLFISVQYSCNQKGPAPAPAAPPALQATINGKTYSAIASIGISTNSALVNGSKPIQFPANTNNMFMNYTYSDPTATYYTHHYVIGQMNISAPGDTTTFFITFTSNNPITTGNYPIYCQGDTTKLNNLPIQSTYVFFTYNPVSINSNNIQYITDSTTTGTFSLTKLDMTNKVASGTFSLTDTRTKGSNPSVLTISNGQFTNLPLQEF